MFDDVSEALCKHGVAKGDGILHLGTGTSRLPLQMHEAALTVTNCHHCTPTEPSLYQ